MDTLSLTSKVPFDRGYVDCYQDRCENVPFASIGGMDNRHTPRAPEYVPEHEREEYMRGYIECCENLWGPDWRDAKFSWKPVLELTSGREA